MPDAFDDTLPELTAETLELYLPLYADGVLSAEETAQVEALLEGNTEAQALLGNLHLLDPLLRDVYRDSLDRPIPIGLARVAVSAGKALSTEPAPVEPSHVSTWRPMLVAACAAGIVFGFGGYGYGTLTGADTARQQAAAQFGWIAQIAGYHQLYSQESRHLVEVTSTDRDHIKTWLGKRTGLEFEIPDLSAQGYTFAGARLLAVNGKPTAQLMYTSDTGGRPMGLCFLKSDGADADFSQQSRDGMEMVTWRSGGFNFIVIGFEDGPDMEALAQSAASGIEI